MRPRVLPITQLGEPVLRRIAKPVRSPASAATARFVRDMIATMRKAKGVGIAAPQVGVSLRIFIVAPEPSVRYPHAPKMPPLPMINPRLVGHSRAMVDGWEGCLSIPGIRGRIPRYRSLEIEFTTEQAERRRARLSGFVARIFQHEWDHINGKVFLDRVKDTRTLMTEREYRRRAR